MFCHNNLGIPKVEKQAAGSGIVKRKIRKKMNKQS